MENQLVGIDTSINCRFPRAKKEQSRVFQFVDSVRDFSSHYGNDAGVSYTAYNVVGRPTIFPKIGDDAKAFLMKTYGPWWSNLPSAKLVNMNTVLPIGCKVLSQDFIEVQYKTPVYPCEINIYETYNPGALVKVLCYCYETHRWHVLWSGKPEFIKLRRFKAFLPTLKRLKWVNFKTDLYRLEFYHHHLDYHYELDAVELAGYRDKPSDEGSLEINKTSLILSHLIDVETKVKSSCSENSFCFNKMPLEVLRLIFSYLDLETLCVAAKVSRLFRNLCYDPMLYNVLNLQPFWHMVTSATLQGLQSRCSSLRKISLSWCGDHQRISPNIFIEFVQETCHLLTCLRLSNCHFIDNQVVKAIAETCKSLQVLDLSSCDSQKLRPAGFYPISQIRNLVYLDVTHTLIDNKSLSLIIRLCTKLEHLFVSGCKNIEDGNGLVKDVAIYLKNIKTLDLSRQKDINATAIMDLAENCQHLVDLDLSWCNNIDISSGCFQLLFKKCNRLKKLQLTSIRAISDLELAAISMHCSELEQLNVLGSYGVTGAGVERVLQSCQKLKLLDVSYCSKINKLFCESLCSSFPAVQIKRSSIPNDWD